MNEPLIDSCESRHAIRDELLSSRAEFDLQSFVLEIMEFIESWINGCFEYKAGIRDDNFKRFD